jgi:hypothetical protein
MHRYLIFFYKVKLNYHSRGFQFFQKYNAAINSFVKVIFLVFKFYYDRVNDKKITGSKLMKFLTL